MLKIIERSPAVEPPTLLDCILLAAALTVIFCAVVGAIR